MNVRALTGFTGSTMSVSHPDIPDGAIWKPHMPPRQAQIQYQAVENIHRLLQLPSHRRHHRRENLHNAWRPVARPTVDGADQESDEADRRPGYGYVASFSMSLCC